MKRENLLEKANYLNSAVKSKRLHFVTTENVAKEISRYSEQLDMCKSDVIVLSALTFQVENISEKLSKTMKALRVPSPRLSEVKKVQVKRLAKKYKGEKTMANTSKTNAEAPKVAQFHLRVTPETYEEIKRKAATFGMTISDYVAFVTLHFDVMEISEKIDEINAKLDNIGESPKKGK